MELPNDAPPGRLQAWGVCLAVALLACLLFAAGIRGYDLWAPDEPRFAEIAREMLASGNWLTPHVNGKPYTEKPPLLFWAITAVSYPFGDVSEATARVPSIVAGVFTVLCAYWLARRLYDARTAFWSALILMTMLLFWWEARTARTDILLTAAMSAALLTFWNWHEDQREGRHGKWWLLAFYAAIAVGLYAKGPPALVFPLCLVFVFYWRQCEERRRLHFPLGVAVAVALVLLWLIPAWMAASGEHAAGAPLSSQGGILDKLYHQTVGRFLMGESKARWPGYYLVNLPLDVFPWTLLLPWTIYWTWKRRNDDPGLRLLLSWILPAFVFFSICVGKRPMYLLPLYPAIAILIARSAVDLEGDGHATWRGWTAGTWSGILLLAALGSCCLNPHAYPEMPSEIGFATGFVGFVVFLLMYLKRSWTGSSLVLALFASMSAVILLVTISSLPVANRFKSAKEFCRPLRTLSESGQEYRLYSLCFSREEYIFYAKHFHTPVFVESLPVQSPGLDEATYRNARGGLARAVEAVSIASPDGVTDAELTALQDAANRALTVLDGEIARSVTSDFTLSLEHFGREFSAADAAFLFVQEEDWRWMLALRPALRAYHVIGHSGVGSREVLLIANDEGLRITSG